jgi:imidazolonepropionase-like amidohydrolase
LEHGITTVRDCGSGYGTSLKKAVEMGFIKGSRVISSGSDWICQTAGHVDYPFFGLDPKLGLSSKADGVDEVIKKTREVIRSGADMIKVFGSYGSASQIGTEDFVNFKNYTLPELKAIVEEAHSVRKTVAIHCHCAEGIRNAIEAGVNTIEHGSFLKDLSDEEINKMKSKNIFLIPTITRSIKGIQSPAMDDFWKAKAKIMLNSKIESMKKAYQYGVKIAAGTDWYGYGENMYEIETYVDNGMTSIDAIMTATKNAAEAIQRSDLGTIEEKKISDIIIVDGNPLDNISLLQDKNKILTVIKDGIIEKNQLND